MRRAIVSCSACLVLVATLTTSLWANDYFLTIGGGPTPTGNQVSLENNVLYFQRTLVQLGLNAQEHLILFADGNNPQRDLQFQNPDRGAEDLHRLMAEIVGPPNGIRFDYRTSDIPGVSGAADPETIQETLNDLSERLKADDRLVLYFTGHGGKERPSRQPRGRRPTASMDEEEKPADETSEEAKSEEETDDSDKEEKDASEDEMQDEKSDDKPEDKKQDRKRPSYTGNHMHLWPRKTMTVTAWTEKLDELPSDTPLIAIMVQCYSGGFGNMIFQGGDPKNGMSNHPRCGFFSTVPDRVAAGCTPNINQAEYREYSSYFWEALSGVSRTGEAITPPDFDEDGQTSLLEAHAYTVLHADTIDIPTRTSDYFLIEYSADQGKDDLVTIHSPIETLLAGADPSERAVIEGLSQRFELQSADRGQEVEDAIKAKREEKKKIDGEVRKLIQKVGSKRHDIKTTLQEQWPEITTPWHPQVTILMTEEADTVHTTVVEHEAYEELQSADEELDAARTEQEMLDLEIVKLERLKYWLERRARIVNLPIVADETKLQQFNALLQLETQFLN